ncbi:hypothetical protein, partial [Nitratireductor arenosus]|uniref:hypothetical protein n=1 Tax=Nitratireductor arenosus TaxID=2682096 RepID=UPI001AEDC56B
PNQMRYQAALRSDCRMALIALCFSARKRKSRIFEAEQKRNKRTAVAGLGAEITTEITTGLAP